MPSFSYDFTCFGAKVGSSDGGQYMLHMISHQLVTGDVPGCDIGPPDVVVEVGVYSNHVPARSRACFPAVQVPPLYVVQWIF